MTTKINAQEIPLMTNANQNLGKNPKAKYLFHFLAALRGFGERADTLKAIASEMYFEAPTENNKLSFTPRLENDTRNKGDTRLAKLGRGAGSFKVCEAKALHAAFTSLMGAEWGDLVTPEQLVLNDIRVVLRGAIGQGLPWPDGLSVLATLQLLALADEPSSPSLNLLPADKFNIMSGPKRGNSDLYSLAAPQVLTAGDKLFLQATEISDCVSAMLIFIATEEEQGSRHSNEIFGMLTFGARTDWSAGRCLLGPKKGAPFQVEAGSGRYGLGVIAATNVDHLMALFPADKQTGRLTLEECQRFLKRLRRARMDNTNDICVSLLPYDVR